MNPSTALATVLVDELVARGVRHVVLCPGSRSAPFAYAAQAAERAGRLTLHVRVDERSAGFLALGLAKLTRVPAVVVTTSGTAVANLHPAVLEAHHGVVPLIVLSADRPVELRGTGANQTTVQPGMFAGAVRWTVDAEAPERRPGEVARWRTLATRAVAHATGTAHATAHATATGTATGARDAAGVGAPGVGAPDVAHRDGVRAEDRQAVAEPGPVHLNVQLREPLVPTDGEPWPEPLDRQSDPAPRAGADEGGAPVGVEPVPRTVVVVGDLPEPDQFERAVRWAAGHGWPVVAEPFGSHPRDGVLPHGPLVLSDPKWLDRHAPDRVVTVGRLTLSRPVAALLRRPGVRVEAVGTHGWIESRPDIAAVHPVTVLDVPAPAGPATSPVTCAATAASTSTATAASTSTATAASTSTATAASSDDSAWAAAWHEAGDRVAAALAASAPAATRWPSGLAVARTVVEALPAGATVFVGSSNAARDLDLAGPRTGALRVVASRGLAGIDGCVSTAIGLALADPGNSPTYALMGDLTFLHDSNGLLVGPLEPRPDLTIVVTNDDGGGIFTLLEPGEPQRAADFERVFGTPTGVDLAALCAAHHVAHLQVSSRQELAAALAQQPSGLRVLEVRLDRSGHRGQHAELREAAAAAVRAGDAAAYRGR